MLEQRHTSIANANKVLAEATAELRRREWDTHRNIWNACFFLNMIAHAHSLLFADLVYERHTWKRMLIAHNLSVLLYETDEDLPSVLGQQFSKSLTDLGVDTDPVRSFRDTIKQVTTFWSNFKASLKSVRWVCGAHRAHDVRALIDAIDVLDLLHVMRISLNLAMILNKLGRAAWVIVVTSSKRSILSCVTTQSCQMLLRRRTRA